MNKKLVLIVDDQLINRKVLHKILSSTYEILEADNGKAAIEIIEKNYENISAVILDIIMPIMDGYEVLSALKKNPKYAMIPVIVSSQMSKEEDEVKALSLGAQDFIAKPYKPNIILQRIRTVIQLRESAATINRVQKDEITGLLTKQFFLDRSEALLKENPDKEYDIIAVGVEHFKIVNEMYGIETGDRFLRHIGEVLSDVIHPIYASRFYGDYFYLLIEHMEDPSVYLNQSLTDQINDSSINMKVRMRFGIYVIHDRDISMTLMCDRARLANDRNKNNYTETYYVYDDTIRKELLNEQFLTAALPDALKEHQFKVYYQPKYDLDLYLMAGAEALVRWAHPSSGMIPPNEFIPIFEKNGMITHLDEYIWETVCQDMHRWIQLGYPPIAVSINVSRVDIYNPKLTEIITGLADKYEIPYQYLHLEITESAYTTNSEQIVAVVRHFRELGFKVEMDDFGSGYSSLNMLSEMPVDIIKLDIGFIENEAKRASGKGILSFVISLAKWLQMPVIAEGVETAEEVAILHSMQCGYVQVFYFSKPIPVNEFEQLLSTSKVTEMKYKGNHTSKEDTVFNNELQNERHMLIVDDIALNRSLLKKIFSEEYQITEKENGQAAWDYIIVNYENIDVILLDLMMPVMDGFTLLSKIRANDKTKNLTVIITSQEGIDAEKKVLDLKADGFISKPYDAKIVCYRVRSAIHARHYLLEMQGTQSKKSNEEAAYHMVEKLKPLFDIVRLVKPEATVICRSDVPGGCDMQSCYQTWDKHERCTNCVSMRALREHRVLNKLEYSPRGIFFVKAMYVPYRDTGAVIEMVSKLDDAYVEKVIDKERLHQKLDLIKSRTDYDSLTRTFNAKFVEASLQKEIDEAKAAEEEIAIIMADMNDFKTVNDVDGLLYGNKILIDTAHILNQVTAFDKGDYVARYRGDRFLVVCRNTAEATVIKRMEKAVEEVRALRNDMTIAFTYGIVFASEFSEFDYLQLIAEAERRLQVKREERKVKES